MEIILSSQACPNNNRSSSPSHKLFATPFMIHPAEEGAGVTSNQNSINFLCCNLPQPRGLGRRGEGKLCHEEVREPAFEISLAMSHGLFLQVGQHTFSFFLPFFLLSPPSLGCSFRFFLSEERNLPNFLERIWWFICFSFFSYILAIFLNYSGITSSLVEDQVSRLLQTLDPPFRKGEGSLDYTYVVLYTSLKGTRRRLQAPIHFSPWNLPNKHELRTLKIQLVPSKLQNCSRIKFSPIFYHFYLHFS